MEIRCIVYRSTLGLDPAGPEQRETWYVPEQDGFHERQRAWRNRIVWDQIPGPLDMLDAMRKSMRQDMRGLSYPTVKIHLVANLQRTGVTWPLLTRLFGKMRTAGTAALGGVHVAVHPREEEAAVDDGLCSSRSFPNFPAAAFNYPTSTPRCRTRSASTHTLSHAHLVNGRAPEKSRTTTLCNHLLVAARSP